MSVKGQTLRSQSSPTAQFVRCYSDSDMIVRRSEVTLRARLWTWLLENHFAVAAHGDRLLVCLLASRFTRQYFREPAQSPS